MSEEDLSESTLEIYAVDLSRNRKFMHVKVTPSGIEDILGLIYRRRVVIEKLKFLFIDLTMFETNDFH